MNPDEKGEGDGGDEGAREDGEVWEAGGAREDGEVWEAGVAREDGEVWELSITFYPIPLSSSFIPHPLDTVFSSATNRRSLRIIHPCFSFGSTTSKGL